MSKNRPRPLARIALFIGMPVLLLLLLSSGASSESLLGKLYPVTKQATLSSRAGTSCVPGHYGEDFDPFCDKNYLCPDGQVARGLVMNVSVKAGESVLTGVGLQCTDPNEIYKSKEIGAFGTAFGGKVYRDACDTGFFLAGVKVATSDRRNVSGVTKICRRYWPVEEREGPNSYGSGSYSEIVGCDGGRFVTGLKASHIVEKMEDGTKEALLKNFRFFCSEMRHWVSDPGKVRDPRDPKTKR